MNPPIELTEFVPEDIDPGTFRTWALKASAFGDNVEVRNVLFSSKLIVTIVKVVAFASLICGIAVALIFWLGDMEMRGIIAACVFCLVMFIAIVLFIVGYIQEGLSHVSSWKEKFRFRYNKSNGELFFPRENIRYANGEYDTLILGTTKPKRRWKKWLGCMSGCVAPPLIFLCLLTLCIPHIQYAREAVRCQNCRNKMEQIGIALQKYHDEHGSFPPAYTVDTEGNPLHSWRTLILPYFGKSKWKEIYDQIRFDEPWNSEHNRQFNEDTHQNTFAYSTEEERQNYSPDDNESLAGPYGNMPSVYACPNHRNDAVKTVYKMVVGDNVLGNVHGMSVSQITRPLGKTILVVEALLPVPWMSPVDFTAEDFKNAVYPYDGKKVWEIREATFRGALNPELGKRKILGGHYRELHILFADGTVKRYWDDEFPPLSEIEAMSRVRE